MKSSEFAELTAFLAIANEGSFAKAAATLQLATPTLSQRIRSLEQRLDVRLLNRTTRSVSLTAPGEALKHEIQAAMGTLDAAMTKVGSSAGLPAGTLRIHASSIAAELLLEPQVAKFHERFPLIQLDIGIGQETVDIVAKKYDAGIRAGHTIDQDMVSVRLTPASRMIVAASPSYLKKSAGIEDPGDLQHHKCLMLRQASGEVLPWRFNSKGREVKVPLEGPIISNSLPLLMAAARDGVGILCTHEDYLAEDIRTGTLVQVMPEYWRTFDGFFIYFPSHRQIPATLRTLIDFLKFSP